MKNLFLILLLSSFSISFNAQDTIKTKYRTVNQVNVDLLKTGNLKEQYDFLFENSDSYRGLHAINDEWLQLYQTNVTDSINKLKTELTIANQNFNNIKNEHSTLKTTYDTLANSNQDSLLFIGIPINKSLYQIIMWSLLVMFGGLFGWFFYKYKNSHILTKTAQQRSEELEQELNDARARALEREQALNRRLFDAEKKHSK